jgi:ABC-type branched-subunit amino acid transport system permease subunit
MTARTVLACTGAVVVGLALFLLPPRILSSFGLNQLSIMIIMALFGLSQGFLWGFGGIMSFGQSAFFGLGAYAYAIAAIALGGSGSAVALAIAIPAIFAALLGYFMFYGRVSDAYVGIITLTIAVILSNVMNSTAGDVYQIAGVPLGGFNGIPGVPPLAMPTTGEYLDYDGTWYVAVGSLVVVYIGLRGILASRFGRVVVAIRENETRATLFGYDPRLYKLIVFALSGGIAGLAGSLYTAWSGFVSPTVFDLSMAAQSVIFVLIGGLGTLLGPILGAVFIQYLMTVVGTQQVLNASLLLGIILVVFVLLVPKGALPMARLYAGRAWRVLSAAKTRAPRSRLEVPS